MRILAMLKCENGSTDQQNLKEASRLLLADRLASTKICSRRVDGICNVY